jgi:curved DNA-binding protein CbpA
MRVSQTNLYRTLQVDPAAEDVVIRAAYRALMKQYHPDHGGNSAFAQQLNAAYATLADPVARRAYDVAARLRGVRPAQASAASERPLAGARSLVEELGEEVFRRFLPRFQDGLTTVFDFTGVLRESSRHRLWLKRVWRADNADARAFVAAVEAARLSRSLWAWGSDFFVGVLPRITPQFRWLLRGPTGPLPRLSFAVALHDLSTGETHAVGRCADLPTFRPFITALAARRASASAAGQPNT